MINRNTSDDHLKNSFPGFAPRDSNLVLWLEGDGKLKILVVLKNSYIYTESLEIGPYLRSIKSGYLEV